MPIQQIVAPVSEQAKSVSFDSSMVTQPGFAISYYSKLDPNNFIGSYSAKLNTPDFANLQQYISPVTSALDSLNVEITKIRNLFMDSQINHFRIDEVVNKIIEVIQAAGIDEQFTSQMPDPITIPAIQLDAWASETVDRINTAISELEDLISHGTLLITWNDDITNLFSTVSESILQEQIDYEHYGLTRDEFLQIPEINIPFMIVVNKIKSVIAQEALDAAPSWDDILSTDFALEQVNVDSVNKAIIDYLMTEFNMAVGQIIHSRSYELIMLNDFEWIVRNFRGDWEHNPQSNLDELRNVLQKYYSASTLDDLLTILNDYYENNQDSSWNQNLFKISFNMRSGFYDADYIRGVPGATTAKGARENFINSFLSRGGVFVAPVHVDITIQSIEYPEISHTSTVEWQTRLDTPVLTVYNLLNFLFDNNKLTIDLTNSAFAPYQDEYDLGPLENWLTSSDFVTMYGSDGNVISDINSATRFDHYMELINDQSQWATMSTASIYKDTNTGNWYLKIQINGVPDQNGNTEASQDFILPINVYTYADKINDLLLSEYPKETAIKAYESELDNLTQFRDRLLTPEIVEKINDIEPTNWDVSDVDNSFITVEVGSDGAKKIILHIVLPDGSEVQLDNFRLSLLHSPSDEAAWYLDKEYGGSMPIDDPNNPGHEWIFKEGDVITSEQISHMFPRNHNLNEMFAAWGLTVETTGIVDIDNDSNTFITFVIHDNTLSDGQNINVKKILNVELSTVDSVDEDIQMVVDAYWNAKNIIGATSSPTSARDKAFNDVTSIYNEFNTNGRDQLKEQIGKPINNAHDLRDQYIEQINQAIKDLEINGSNQSRVINDQDSGSAKKASNGNEYTIWEIISLSIASLLAIGGVFALFNSIQIANVRRKDKAKNHGKNTTNIHKTGILSVIIASLLVALSVVMFIVSFLN